MLVTGVNKTKWGCGYKFFSHENRLKFSKMVGIDISGNGCSSCRKKDMFCVVAVSRLDCIAYELVVFIARTFPFREFNVLWLVVVLYCSDCVATIGVEGGGRGGNSSPPL